MLKMWLGGKWVDGEQTLGILFLWQGVSSAAFVPFKIMGSQSGHTFPLQLRFQYCALFFFKEVWGLFLRRLFLNIYRNFHMLCIKLHYVKYMKKIKIKMKNKANKKKTNRTQEHF